MKITITALLFMVALSGCQFSKSVKKDLLSGLFMTGDGLACDDVYLSVNNLKTDRTTFIYGEEFVLNFNNIEGFQKDNENVFPGMKLFVLSKTGDTVLQTNDLYADYPNGLKLSTLLLTADITVASPMKSKDEYALYVNIWDKKGSGKFNAKLEFKIKSNDQILTEASKTTYDEIYLFSKERSKVIPGNKIKFNENTYVIFEGLTGFKEENGMVFPGLSIKGTDKDGKQILDYDDLFADYTGSGLAISDFNSRVASHFIINGNEFNNPLHLELSIWDKKSDARIKVTSDLVIE
jgi:hypothetical protein